MGTATFRVGKRWRSARHKGYVQWNFIVFTGKNIAAPYLRTELPCAQYAKNAFFSNDTAA